MDATTTRNRREPWNKGKLVGQKAPLKLKEIWAIRVGLQMQQRARELADKGMEAEAVPLQFVHE